MVTLRFKLSELGTVTLEIEHPEKLEELIRRCTAGPETDAGGYIATRNGKIIQGNTLIREGDTVTILPAISGG